MAEDDGIRWYSYLILIFHVGWSAGIILLTHHDFVPLAVRWVVTGIFIALVLVFGIIDKVANPGDVDATAIDRWTIPHTLAGVVFGLWFVPLLWVLILVFFWECFEFSVKGFGDQEVILNRVVDMGVAVGGWLVVVFVLMATSGTPFLFV
jgi:hypothetical protein